MDLAVLESEKFEIIRELGRGGMGVVYLAEDKLLKRTVALKVLYEYLNRESAFVERFQKEARSVSSLHHPNIVAVHGLEIVNNTFLIDMEYVDGLSLDRFMRNAAVPPPVAAQIAGDILEGLATCHGVGVIHRDIKPANILLTQQGIAKIADFGLATAYASHMKDSVRSQSSSGFFMGTPRYAPPEAWEGKEPSPGWDLYSLGIMLFEMLSGTVAFPGESPMAIMRQHLAAPLPSIAEAAPDASPVLAGLVDALIAGKGGGASPTALEALQRLQATPEYGKARDSETARTIRAALRNTQLKRSLPDLGKWIKHGAYAAGLILIGGAAVWLLQSNSVTPAPAPAAGATTAKLDAPLVFLRPQRVGDSEAGDAIWKLSFEGETARIVSLGDLELLSLALIPAGGRDRFTVTGGWAEYLSPARGSFRYGAVRGEALIDRAGNTLSLSLEKINSRDRESTSAFLVAKPLSGTYSERSFVERLESAPALQNLIYNELMPRKLAWAGEVEMLMPGLARGRLAVPRADTAIAVNGHLEESVWMEEFRTGPSENAEAGEGGAALRARWSDNALILGFTASSPVPGARLRVVLDSGLKDPGGISQHFHVEIGPGGITGSGARAGARELPWQCNWEVAMAVEGGEWQAELRIPLSELGLPARPRLHQRWRINAALLPVEGDQALARWGFEKLDEVNHGLMLVFQEAKP
ncbi:MAG: protein kinase [Candidatus Hydrogenedentes bacterium]|nr:protein kinase [Candidatus Hydrogenedentota bacterium]